MTPGPIGELAAFARALRGRGLTVTPDAVGDMARSLSLVDLSDRDQVYAALRCLAVTDPAQLAPYDEEFRRFFEGEAEPSLPAEHHSRLSPHRAAKPLFSPMPGREEGDTESQQGASDLEKIAERDFAGLDDEGLAEARRMVMGMLWEPERFMTRRWTGSRQGRRPDLRRTLRRAIGPEGELLPIETRERRLRRRPLIVIADISGSMEKYADLFLVFAHAAQRRLENTEIFTFSTRLTRITEDMRQRDTKAALAGVTRTVSDWSGGTRIGEAIRAWNRDWSRRLARGGPMVLILSDGWDCGDPEVLSEEMARLSRSVHRVYWLNPLAARPDYRPATQGMRAVLPHIDRLLPAASVNDLRDVVRLLDEAAANRPAASGVSRSTFSAHRALRTG